MSPINVYVLEQSEADVPENNDWLSTSEIHFADGFRFAKRRADWRQGRWTAKLAIASHLGLPVHLSSLTEIEIRPAPSGAPQAFVRNSPAAATISLSHRAGRAMCAVTGPGVQLGCDLEAIETHSAAFVADYFTRAEQDLISNTENSEQSLITALLWSAKESALKALHEGLRLDTRAVVVRPQRQLSSGREWQPLLVHQDSGGVFEGWWSCDADMVRTVVADPAPVKPLELRAAAFVSSIP